MNFLTFFIVFWTIVALAWQAAEVPVKPTKLYRTLEQLVLAPITVVGWIKVGVNAVVERLK